MKNGSKVTKLRSILGGLALILGLTVSSLGLTTRLHGTSSLDTDEARIAAVTAGLLQKSSYSGHQDTQTVSGKFLDRYLEMLDGNRLYFLQSDLEEFAPYRTNLAAMAVKDGDTHPAHEIFKRFLQRLEERVAYDKELLQTQTDTFDFTGHDSYRWGRRDAPRPRNLAEAKELWRQNLRYDYLQEKLSNHKPEEIVKTLLRRYERTLHTTQQWKNDEVLEMYLTALAHAYDPHSDYMGRRQSEDFAIAMNLSLVGIGATLQADDGYCKIRDLVPGGPAARSKLLKVGDRIVAVAQEGKQAVDIVDMPIQEAVDLIRGSKGTVVRLTVIPGDSADSSRRKTISLIRDEIHLEDQEAKARLVEVPGQGDRKSRLGIIDLPSFYSGSSTDHGSAAHGAAPRSATSDVAKLIGKLKRENAQGIILDLRRNGGGSLEEAVALTGLFIKRGPVVQTKGPDGDVQVEVDPNPSVMYDGPLVVLTSRLSASASEILAGALQDYGRAIVVGDSSTFGKGTVQSMLPLANVMRRANLPVKGEPGELKLTIRKFYRPDGASTQLRGVASDIVLPSSTEVLKVSEAEMSDPLPWDSVPPAAHAELNRVAPWVSALRKASAERTAANRDFIWLREDNDRIKARLAEPVVSLNENQRRQEKAEADSRAKERTNERTGRQPSREIQYEITLKNADRPGLPEPLSVAAHSPQAEITDNDSESPDLAQAGKDLVSDRTLEETEHIMLDYITLLKAPANATFARHLPGQEAGEQSTHRSVN
jgi:carboxyl-terminal processing protease